MSSSGFRKDLQLMDQNSQEGISGSNIPFVEVTSALCRRAHSMCFFSLGFLLHAVELSKKTRFV